MSNSITEVRGRRVVVRFDGQKCIHSRNCVLGRPDVFVPNAAGEWIHPDNASPEAVMQVALSCPSGAITCERLDGGEGESAPLVNTLRVRENGPLAIHAPVVVAGRDEGYRVTLCRCGASQHKPFCDGSHAAIGFTATGEPSTRESQPLAARDGTVTVSPQPNGPLKVDGPLEFVSGTGRTIDRGTQAFLCRCGASGNKPFCDGSHKRVGFVAD